MRTSSLVIALSSVSAAALLTSCASVVLTTPASTPYLYVASGAAPGVPQPTITGYDIAADGSLKPTPCAPLTSANVYAFSGSGSLLFTSSWQPNPAASTISTYSIANNGCLSFQSNTDVTRQGTPLTLFIDPRGQTLYSWVWRSTTVADLNSYSIHAATGALQHTGLVYAGFPTYFGPYANSWNAGGMLAFTPDDDFAVTASFYPPDTYMGIFQRSSDGTLQAAKSYTNSPAGPGQTFYPIGAASALDGHFIVAGAMCSAGIFCTGPIQLAVYTLDGSGNFTTRDTSQTLVTPPSNGLVERYAFSPDARFFAAAGGGGIDVYLWNPSTAALLYLDSITLSGNGYTGDLVQDFAWDRYDHLVFTSADSSGNTALQVYAVTPSGSAPAPGSPHKLPLARTLTIVDVTPH